MDPTVRVTPDWRLRGPTGNLHAGYVAGLAARGRAATVVLRRPVPVTSDPQIVLHNGELITRSGQHPWLQVASVAPADPAHLDVVPHALPSLADALVAASASGTVPPHPGCAVCDPAGVQHSRVGPLNESRTVAGVWVPTPRSSPGNGSVSPAVVWALLSCAALSATRHLLPVGAHPAPQRCTGIVTGPVRAGRPHIVVGWPDPGFSGIRSAAVLLDPRGEVCAVLRQATPRAQRPLRSSARPAASAA
ncbi:hypothetical protein ACTG9Q_15750 [Actinokineospora sp. 24-640]